LIAADLLAQAEHDTDALPILVTTHEPLIAQVEAQLASQLSVLPTRETAAVSMTKVRLPALSLRRCRLMLNPRSSLHYACHAGGGPFS